MYHCTDIDEATDLADNGTCVGDHSHVLRQGSDLERLRLWVPGRVTAESLRRQIDEERAEAEREYGRPSRPLRRQGR